MTAEADEQEAAREKAEAMCEQMREVGDALVMLGAHVLDALCSCCVRLNPQHGDGYTDRTCRCTDTESFRAAIANLSTDKEETR
jgi:hypothetical protein